MKVKQIVWCECKTLPRYEDEMPCMKLYAPAECYAAVSIFF